MPLDGLDIRKTGEHLETEGYLASGAAIERGPGRRQEGFVSNRVPEATRMWSGGPLRLFSETRFSGSIQVESGQRTGFAGSYVCDECKEPSIGVYAAGPGWICAGCKDGTVRIPGSREKLRERMCGLHQFKRRPEIAVLA